ncbi:MAG TPA: hypothetical protein VGG40_08810 [Solirubrobacterales bacterium]
MIEPNKAKSGRYDQIEREAFERYLLQVARGLAAEEEQLEQAQKGTDPPWIVREIVLLSAGTRNAALEFRTVNRAGTRVAISTHQIWAEPFLDADGKRTANLNGALGDILMHLRGG